jgi:prepilin-type N-terminal cleavage/methylation domain-containing protein
MGLHVFRNNGGMTIVEVLMALVIVLIVSLALLQTALLGIDSNMRNVLRDEAVRVAEEDMDTVRNAPFASIANSTSSVTRDLRNADIAYTVDRTVNTLNTANKQVNVSVGWTWKGQNYVHNISTIVRAQ